MGVDIHLVVQVRHPTPPHSWVTVVPALGVSADADPNRGIDSIYEDRNTVFFGHLAGVRYTPLTPALAPSRGFPPDFVTLAPADPDFHPVTLPDKTTINIWMGEHSYSHATLQEIAAYPWPEDATHTAARLVAQAQLAADRFLDHTLDPTDVRVVFGFDN